MIFYAVLFYKNTEDVALTSWRKLKIGEWVKGKQSEEIGIGRVAFNLGWLWILDPFLGI